MFTFLGRKVFWTSFRVFERVAHRCANTGDEVNQLRHDEGKKSGSLTVTHQRLSDAQSLLSVLKDLCVFLWRGRGGL